LALTKWPASRLLIFMEMVNGVSALTAPKFAGNANLELGMLAVEGMTPMGAGLQEPVVICCPLVMGRFGTVRQKLMKLFVDTNEGT